VNAIGKEELNFKPDRQMPRVAPLCSLGLNTEIARAHLRFRIPPITTTTRQPVRLRLIKMSSTTLLFDGIFLPLPPAIRMLPPAPITGQQKNPDCGGYLL
jgi:hypothetical protein